MSDLKLESNIIPAAKPTPKVCGSCKNFIPFRDPKTKRVHPSEQGRCGWEMPKITWPLAYRIKGYGYGRFEDPPIPFAGGVWNYTNAESCACHTQI
jgi:hypothetical protein